MSLPSTPNSRHRYGTEASSPMPYGTPRSIISGGDRTPGTPYRQRPDIGSNHRPRVLRLGDELSNTSFQDDNRLATAMSPSATSDISVIDGAGKMVIWGTDICINEAQAKFKQFLLNFSLPDLASQDDTICSDTLNPSHPYYIQRIDEISVLEEPYLDIDCEHIQSFDENLYRQLINYPTEIISAFDMAANEIFFDKYMDIVLKHQIQVRFYNARQTKNMRILNPEDIDKLISINGLVIRISNIIPEMYRAFFQCYVCMYTLTVELDHGKISEPTLCAKCKTNHSFNLIHNRSQFSDKQFIKIQESPEDMPAGQTPQHVMAYVYADLVDYVEPGDRVIVTGIYRAVPLRSNPRTRNIRSVYRSHVDVLHVKKYQIKQTPSEALADPKCNGEGNVLSDDRIDALEQLSRRPDLYDVLANSLAPSIFENLDIKKGILLQLFGGTKKNFKGIGKGNCRSDIHILLCGDPGTSKSQLLRYVHEIVPRGQYTSGKGSTAVGLTAYVTRDMDTNQPVLQTGALVLSDNGVCCIDEFDKMNESTRSVLHEVMEQQTLSIAKAGIICQLNARTSILAAANPVDSQWNTKKTIVDNIQLPHTLLSRFDLIFLLLDYQSEAFDRKLATHLVSLYYKDTVNRLNQDPQDGDNPIIDQCLVKDYIEYAKNHIHPKLSEEAQQTLIETYISMRMIGSTKGFISAYPRQLESLIRLSEAHARMRWSSIVEISDVSEAERLYKDALKQTITDPTTGLIDMSILATGQSSETRKKHREMVLALRSFLANMGKAVTISYLKLYQEFRESSDLPVTRDMFERGLKDLQEENFLVIIGKTIKTGLK